MTSSEVYAESCGQTYRLQVLDDFRKFKETALSSNGWSKKYSDSHTLVETRPSEDGDTGIRVVRVRREMLKVSCDDLYDSLHDASYRATWDDNMLEGKNIVKLNPHNDIGYYAVKLPWPLTNRDFCNMRSWMEFADGEYIIFNHSVTHPNCPVRKEFVRAKSILSGYLIQPHSAEGCVLTYLTLSDPCGSIPHAFINFTTTRLVPKVMDQLEKCALKYLKYYQQNYTCSREELPWRVGKIDWCSNLNFPGDAVEAETAGSNVDAANVRQVTEGDGKSVATPPADTSFVEKSHLPPPAEEHQVGATPEVENNVPGIAAVEQYKQIMSNLTHVADATFIHEGTPPNVTDYVTRVGVFVDGVRRAAPQ
uniref:START domain-containing protein 10 n=1 Tax=Trypanosoma congolense (strain IL3000) TaxID=1068625 RepID=G0UK58_TRYCI|nr:conserved hypothetical protein [Trypanosoma congolense IL3000]